MKLQRAWLVLLLAACVAAGAGGGVRAGVAAGRLAGVTQISYGCPGPVRVGQECERWLPFPGARFSVVARAIAPASGSRPGRVVVSDQRGRFSIVLAVGVYALAPLAQVHTRGGTRLLVRVLAGKTASVLIRFEGVPRMV